MNWRKIKCHLFHWPKWEWSVIELSNNIEDGRCQWLFCPICIDFPMTIPNLEEPKKDFVQKALDKYLAWNDKWLGPNPAWLGEGNRTYPKELFRDLWREIKQYVVYVKKIRKYGIPLAEYFPIKLSMKPGCFVLKVDAFEEIPALHAKQLLEEFCAEYNLTIDTDASSYQAMGDESLALSYWIKDETGTNIIWIEFYEAKDCKLVFEEKLQKVLVNTCLDDE